MSDSTDPRPPRPLGVTLAIFASTVLFSLFPLIQVLLLFNVRQHFISQSFDPSYGDPIISGADVLGVPDTLLTFQAFIAVIFLVIAVMAWRGRPPQMRFVLMGAVLFLTVLRFMLTVSPSITPPDPQAGYSSLDSILGLLNSTQFVLNLLVMLYVVWYLNRGPARAFYRGSYLTPPETATPEA
ncbi:MAG: hypothetical protein JNM70_10725 [Anaerolineae bacterium]|nr:hypothetical protein [Anaerolineae bacterium]